VVNEETVMAAVDLFPTFCHLAGVAPPAVEFDGEDMSGAILGEPRVREKPILWEYARDETYLKPGLPDDQSPNLAIRDGRWKLLLNDDGGQVELYDFSVSPSERDNVAEANPGVAGRLAGQLLEWRRALPVLEEK
jgi:arylsulfatase A-like enzyme